MRKWVCLLERVGGMKGRKEDERKNYHKGWVQAERSLSYIGRRDSSVMSQTVGLVGKRKDRGEILHIGRSRAIEEGGLINWTPLPCLWDLHQKHRGDIREIQGFGHSMSGIES